MPWTKCVDKGKNKLSTKAFEKLNHPKFLSSSRVKIWFLNRARSWLPWGCWPAEDAVTKAGRKAWYAMEVNASDLDEVSTKPTVYKEERTR